MFLPEDTSKRIRASQRSCFVPVLRYLRHSCCPADHPVAIALKNILGLVCDPVAGLVEIPCIKRNASGVAGAFVAAEMALAGIDSAIPADEVIWSMKRIGDVMSPTLKETAEGGLAATPTGRKLHDQVFGPGNVSGGCSGCSGCHS